MAKEKIVDVEQLIEDDLNFNLGTERGQQLIDKSFSELGAGRSVLLDKNNRLIAGNKSKRGFMAAGGTKVRIIETDGTELIAVKRTDVDLDSEKGRKMALADNATTQANLAWDEKALEKAREQWGVEPEDWGVKPVGELDMDKFFEEESGKQKADSLERKIIVTVPVGDSYSAEEIQTVIQDAVKIYQGVKVELK